MKELEKPDRLNLIVEAVFGRPTRSVVVIGIYAGLVVASLFLAYELRFDFEVPPEQRASLVQVLGWVVGLKLVALFLARQMGSMISFFGVADFVKLVGALLASAVVLLGLRYTGMAQVEQLSPPRGVLLIDFLVCLAACCSFRLGARLFRERFLVSARMRGRVFERVAIIGAGDTGASLVSDLLGTPARGLRPVAFLDDETNKHGRFIHGVRVEGAPEDFANLPALQGVRHAIVAMPSAPSKRISEIALFLGRLGVQMEIVPAIEDLASGKARVSRIRPVEIQDLLGRPAISLDTASIRHLVEAKAVMVTGAGGSIGTELCRQIAGLNPRRLLLVEQSEPALFAIEQELQALGFSGAILPCMADILDCRRMKSLFTTHAPQIVFHAAAHKHVFLMERQPAEALKNNAVGTRKLAELAAAGGVEAFVLISTDKAINPTNVMGASKRLAELHLQAVQAGRFEGIRAASEADVGIATDEPAPAARLKAKVAPPETQVELPPDSPVRTKFMAVRFGNVLGSSGSVVPIFKRQIEMGGPVTVTHADVTRYFMTIPEAVGLVLQASALGSGGEIFCLDMGEPVKIVDLARNMIELSGYKVGEDIEIKFTGLKPGEKLYEELQHHTEQHVPTSHPRIMRFVSDGDPANASAMAREELEPFVDELTPNEIKRVLKVVIPEYTPYLD